MTTEINSIKVIDVSGVAKVTAHLSHVGSCRAGSRLQLCPVEQTRSLTGIQITIVQVIGEVKPIIYKRVITSGCGCNKGVINRDGKQHKQATNLPRIS